jgi:hypothetical protein
MSRTLITNAEDNKAFTGLTDAKTANDKAVAGLVDARTTADDKAYNNDLTGQ